MCLRKESKENFCAVCGLSDLPSSSCSGIIVIDWIQCDKCRRWCHEVCIETTPDRDSAWFCQLCSESEVKRETSQNFSPMQLNQRNRPQLSKDHCNTEHNHKEAGSLHVLPMDSQVTHELAMEDCEGHVELARKKRELEIIEEQIACKKAAIAFKKKFVCIEDGAVVRERFTDKKVIPRPPPDHEKDVPIKDRVHSILKRWPRPTVSRLKQSNLFPPKGVKSFVEKRNISILLEDGQLAKDRLPLDSDNDHPLKWRVMSILKQRRNPGVEVASNRKQSPVEEPGSTSLRAEFPDQEASSKGFLRFLSVLNKGVDVAMLTAIVNKVKQTAACEGLPREGPHKTDEVPHKTDEVPATSTQESLQINQPADGAPLQDHRRSNSMERKNGQPDSKENLATSSAKIEPPRSIKPRHSRWDVWSGSSSPSPEKERKEREDKERFGRIQVLLETIGLELGEEEVSRLTDRTKERLYGTKHPRERRESERDGRCSDRRRRRSSSRSDRSSRISPQRRHHRWEASGEHRCSGDPDSAGKSVSPAGHPYCRDPVFPASRYSQVSTLPGSSSTHYSHYASHADYYSSLYNSAFSQGWSYAVTQATQHSLPVEPPSSNYSEQYSHFPHASTYYYSSSANGSAVSGVTQGNPALVPPQNYDHFGLMADCPPATEMDLATEEADPSVCVMLQSAVPSSCLKVIETVGPKGGDRCLAVLTEARRRRTGALALKKYRKASFFRKKRRKLRAEQRREQAKTFAAGTSVPQGHSKAPSDPRVSALAKEAEEKERKPMTEEEMKAKLKIKAPSDPCVSALAKEAEEKERKPMTEEEMKAKLKIKAPSDPRVSALAKEAEEKERKPMTEEEMKAKLKIKAPSDPRVSALAKEAEEKERKPMTEEEMKAKLKIKLEEFNKKMKQKRTHEEPVK